MERAAFDYRCQSLDLTRIFSCRLNKYISRFLIFKKIQEVGIYDQLKRAQVQDSINTFNKAEKEVMTVEMISIKTK